MGYLKRTVTEEVDFDFCIDVDDVVEFIEYHSDEKDKSVIKECLNIPEIHGQTIIDEMKIECINENFNDFTLDQFEKFIEDVKKK